MTGEQRLPKSARLRKRREYLLVQRRGRRFFTRLFVVLYRDGPCPWPRLGITASRKVGCAVARNRAKRLVREAFRRNQARLPAGVDLVVVAAPTLAAAAYDEVESALLVWADRLAARARDGLERDPVGRSAEAQRDPE